MQTPYDSFTLDGQQLRAPSGSLRAAILADLTDGLPRAREAVQELQELLERLSGYKFEADPYVNVNDILPALKQIRLNLTTRGLDHD